MTGYPQQPGPPPGYPVPNPERRPSSWPLVALSPFDLAVTALAVLVFIFSFLPWFGVGVGGASTSFSGWDFPLGSTAVALLVVAGLFVLLPLLDTGDAEKKAASPVAALLALVGAVLMVVQISRGAGALFDVAGVSLSRQWGLILALVFAVFEAAAAVVGWLAASGRIPTRSTTPSPYQQAWSSPGYPPGYQQAQANYPQYGYPQPTAYGQPPAGNPQPPPVDEPPADRR